MTAFSSSDYLLNSSKEYSIYVCKSRAIPHAGDGLKHVQRMVLWLLRNRGEKIKTIALSGLLGYEKLHVHGEKAAQDAIGLLAAPFRNNIPLIEGLGQFGSRTQPDKEGIGAPRYTEVRRAKSAELMLYHDLDIIPLGDNYDGSHKQPFFFLPLIPLVLLNGVSGIAVGYSTDIMPHNVKCLIDATKAALLDKPIQQIKPSFDKYNITVDATDKPNQWVFSGKVEIIDTSTVKIIEIPPGFEFKSDSKDGKKRASSGFINFLNALEDEDAIQSFTDRSTDRIDITVKFKRGHIAGWTEDKILDFFKMREKTTERIVVLDWDGERIRTYETPEALVKDFAQWRFGWYKVRYDKMIADSEYDFQYWTALKILFASQFATKLGSYSNKNEMKEHIKTLLGDHLVDEKQMDKIIGLSTYFWTKDFSGEVDARVLEIEKNITSYKEIREDTNKLKQVYIKELNDLAKSLKI